MPRPSQANCYAAAEGKPQRYDALAGLEITSALFPTPTRDLNEGTISSTGMLISLRSLIKPPHPFADLPSSTDNFRAIGNWPLEADYFHSPSSIRNICYLEPCSWNRFDLLAVLNRNYHHSQNLPLGTNNLRTPYSPTTFF